MLFFRPFDKVHFGSFFRLGKVLVIRRSFDRRWHLQNGSGVSLQAIATRYCPEPLAAKVVVYCFLLSCELVMVLSIVHRG